MLSDFANHSRSPESVASNGEDMTVRLDANLTSVACGVVARHGIDVRSIGFGDVCHDIVHPMRVNMTTDIAPECILMHAY